MLSQIISKSLFGWNQGGASISHSRVDATFLLTLTLLNFWIKLTQKGYFRTKKYENYLRILHIQINLDSKFQLQQFWFLKKFPKKSILPVEITKNEHNYWVLHIQISRSTNFQLKLTVAIFWTKFFHKG